MAVAAIPESMPEAVIKATVAEPCAVLTKAAIKNAIGIIGGWLGKKKEETK